MEKLESSVMRCLGSCEFAPLDASNPGIRSTCALELVFLLVRVLVCVLVRVLVLRQKPASGPRARGYCECFPLQMGVVRQKLTERAYQTTNMEAKGCQKGAQKVASCY